MSATKKKKKTFTKTYDIANAQRSVLAWGVETKDGNLAPTKVTEISVFAELYALYIYSYNTRICHNTEAMKNLCAYKTVVKCTQRPKRAELQTVPCALHQYAIAKGMTHAASTDKGSPIFMGFDAFRMDIVKTFGTWFAFEFSLYLLERNKDGMRILTDGKEVAEKIHQKILDDINTIEAAEQATREVIEESQKLLDTEKAS